MEPIDYDKKLTKEQSLILDMFEQACMRARPGGYGHYFAHHCISTYERTQAYLVENGIISIEDTMQWVPKPNAS